jgi:serine/threonine-protein kinase
MTRKGPLITLIAGLCLALILVAISMNATSKERDRRGRSDAALQSPEPTPVASASPSPAPPSPSAAAGRGTYAARANGAGTVAIAVRDGKAIAYVCDGVRTEAWFQGTATDGALSLNGLNGTRITGKIDGGTITGAIELQGKRWSFIAPPAHPPGGLYRAAVTVSGARIDGGWIVLPDGRQVGVLSVNSAKAPAPRLDTESRSTSVNGQRVPATPIDGSSGSGF